MGDVIKSYNIASLTDEYRTGSRQWMFNEVEAWLKHLGINSGVADRDTIYSRIFLLLAGAGMGKSVFSAVINIFLAVRINQDRSLVLVSAWAIVICFTWV